MTRFSSRRATFQSIKNSLKFIQILANLDKKSQKNLKGLNL